MLGFSNSFIFLIVTIAIITIGEIVVSPATMALSVNMAPENEKGRYMGVLGLFENSGWSFAPFIGGILLDAFPGRSSTPWALISLFGFLAVLGYSSLKRKLPEGLNRVQ